MFSGIVAEKGIIQKISKKKSIVTLEVFAPKIAKKLKIAESVALNGVCTTVVKKTGRTFTIELMPETLKRSNLGDLRLGDRVNLEDSLRLREKISGHFVLGHVDTIVKVKKIVNFGGSKRIYFTLPSKYARYIKEKGAVALNGVSLTVSARGSNYFTADFIPFTLQKTTFGGIVKGAKINLEVDVLARYVLD